MCPGACAPQQEEQAPCSWRAALPAGTRGGPQAATKTQRSWNVKQINDRYRNFPGIKNPLFITLEERHCWLVRSLLYMIVNPKPQSSMPLSAAVAAAKSLQSCPILHDPMDCSSPGSSIHGIFQTRVLEWGAIAFSDGLNKPIKIEFFSFFLRYFLN